MNSYIQQIKLVRFLKQLTPVFIPGVFLALALVGFNSIYQPAPVGNNPNFISVDLDSLQPYDPYYETKIYLPVPDKIGFQVNLPDTSHAKYLELLLSPQCVYEVKFYGPQGAVGTVTINTFEAAKTVSRLPEEITTRGYTKLFIIPLQGKIYYLSYVNLIDDYEENQILKEYPPATLSRVWGTDKIGDPHKVAGIIAYLAGYDDKGNLEISIGNIGALPVELVSLSHTDENVQFSFNNDKVIPPSEPQNSIQYITYKFEHVDAELLVEPQKLFITYKYTDTPDTLIAYINPFSRRNDEIFNGTLIRETDTTHNFSFVIKEENRITFDGDYFLVDKPLILPPDTTIVIQPGQTFDIVNSAFIISYSPIIATGTQGAPISFISSDGTGSGLTVLQTGPKSQLTYVVFDGLASPTSGIWGLTGAVTFYESDVDILNCSFLNNSSEDGLNIVRSKFYINKSRFYNTASDAFDSDFSTGLIENTQFENTVNDGLDISTSDVKISDSTFFKIGDKGISGGENSLLEVHNINIDQGIIGIASKDKSLITGNNVSISNTQIGMALYQKKPEFGPADIILTDTTLSGHISLDYLIQSGSSLSVNGKEIISRSKDKEKVLLDKIIAGEKIQW